MEIYLVGGAVRDQLLGLPVTEHDWVVVGASEAEMKALGYRSVGKDFPVFLHPDTGEEYALARTERKTGKGHTGFECSTEEVALEDDLKRRDLTINAIAMDADGKMVDPWRGRHDLDHQILRHVSAAFEEDPLRVLRVARFAARFHALGFTVHPSTAALMRRMVARGDLAELTAERVWLEFEKALATDHPEIFFKLLEQVGAGHILWPEITQAGVHSLAAMARKSLDPRFRFAALLGHLAPDLVQAFGRRLKAPNRLTDFARVASAHYDTWHQGAGLGPEGTVDLLYAADAFRQPDRFRDLNGFYELANGSPDADLTAAYWLNCLDIATAVTASDVDSSLTGKDIGDAIRAEQVRQIQVNSEED